MKALSVRQPWASLIVDGYKPVENRTWSTKYRGPVLIHAGKVIDFEGYKFVKAESPHIWMPAAQDLQRRGIIGQATLVDVVTEHESSWFSGPYGFVLEDAEPLPFHPCPGRLGFFEVDYP